jgi:hypothetical protein
LLKVIHLEVCKPVLGLELWCHAKQFPRTTYGTTASSPLCTTTQATTKVLSLKQVCYSCAKIVSSTVDLHSLRVKIDSGNSIAGSINSNANTNLLVSKKFPWRKSQNRWRPKVGFQVSIQTLKLISSSRYVINPKTGRFSPINCHLSTTASASDNDAQVILFGRKPKH